MINKNTPFAALAALIGAVAALPAAAAEPKAVVATYIEIGHAKYEDSLITAKKLDAAIDAFLANPSDEGLKAARAAWIEARVPYQQTEAYRFGNPVVDDWEGRVNAWPLDEGLIDYVDTGYGAESDENTLYTANVIANAEITIDGAKVDAAAITPELISATLHEAGSVEANVASGYHAIEFLLWGQDLNGTGPGAGNRPFTDYAKGDACTNGHCDRRAQYLSSASKLLVTDLQEMVGAWATGGAARGHLEGLEPKAALSAMLTGMGSLSYGELAGERMKLGLLLHDPEEEHDCFSDNTHASHLNDAVGIREVYLGSYARVDGTTVKGASLADLVTAKDKALDDEMRAKLDATLAAMNAMADRAKGGEAYDQMIGEGNEAGNAAVQAAIDGLVDQTRSIERVIAALELGTIELEGSDSLDKPEAVFE